MWDRRGRPRRFGFQGYLWTSVTEAAIVEVFAIMCLVRINDNSSGGIGHMYLLKSMFWDVFLDSDNQKVRIEP